MIVGYARTSTVEQAASLHDQIDTLEKSGCERIYSEVASGTRSDRVEFLKAVDFVREGDELVFTRPDRFARNTAELLQFVESLDKKGVRVRILSMNVDTHSATGKLMITMMAAIASFETQLMRERQMVGIAAAKAAGRYKGRAPTARAKAPELHRLISAGVAPKQAAKMLNISIASYYRIAKSATH